jgi:putative protease
MNKIEIVCPAGTLPALKSAVLAGADTVYVGLQNETNARNFPGLNFTKEDLIEGVKFAHENNSKVYVALNTFATGNNTKLWKDSLHIVAESSADAGILADVGMLDYAKTNLPNLRRHLSVQASASSVRAINFYVKHFGVSRVVLPRVLTMKEIEDITPKINTEVEIFAFGGLCVMAEGKCMLSSYATGDAPNTKGVCSPAHAVSYKEENYELISKLDKFTINKFSPTEAAGYPTLCKGRFKANNTVDYLFDEPSSLNILPMMPRILKANIKALKIEGRQRGQAYVANVVKQFRDAIDNAKSEVDFSSISEGQTKTTGAFNKKWL